MFKVSAKQWPFSDELAINELEQIYDGYLTFCNDQGFVDADKLAKVPFLTSDEKFQILRQELNQNNSGRNI